MTLKTRLSMLVFICASLAFVILYFNKPLTSEIIIADEMQTFVDAVDNNERKQKLIVIDLDDTLIMAKGLIGTPTWFYTMINKLRQQGFKKKESYDLLREIDLKVQSDSDMVVVERATINAIKRWHHDGHVIILLTSKPAIFKDATIKQLKKLELNFSSKKFRCIKRSFSENNGLFSQGIIFVKKGGSKRDAFREFLDKAFFCGHDFEFIAYADDQKRYIEGVQEICRKRKKDFLGMIYGRALATRNFDEGKAHAEIKSLERHLNKEIVPMKYRSMFSLD